jgi:tRNA (guanosine-2'-O-)-methyltransferase
MLPFLLLQTMTDLRLINFLSEFVSERRLALIEHVLNNRTRYATVLLEDIYQSQNASAVLRTCECLGIQDIHVVENRNPYHYNPGVAMGSGKWIHLKKYNKQPNNTLQAIDNLKKHNYRIIATVPGENCIPLNDFDVEKGKFAIVLGSEIEGISEDVRQNADEFLTIPMFGFTESYNISVSTALILYQLMDKLKKSVIDWHLTYDERMNLKLEWLKASVKKPELLVKNFQETICGNMPKLG